MFAGILRHFFREKAECYGRLPGDKKFQCPNCPSTFVWKCTLKRHLRNECGKEPRFKCPHCDYRGKWKANVCRHIKRVHKNCNIYVLTTATSTSGWPRACFNVRRNFWKRHISENNSVQLLNISKLYYFPITIRNNVLLYLSSYVTHWFQIKKEWTIAFVALKKEKKKESNKETMKKERLKLIKLFRRRLKFAEVIIL